MSPKGGFGGFTPQRIEQARTKSFGRLDDTRDIVPPWTLRFDGLYEPRFTDRGIATYGFVAYHGDERVHAAKGLVLGPGEGGSANPDVPSRPRRIADAAVAEFAALVHALSWLVERPRAPTCAVRVEGDNRLAIETVAGRWDLTSARLLPLRDLARDLVAKLGGADLAKIPREANAEADALSREAYHEAMAAHPEWRARPAAKRL